MTAYLSTYQNPGTRQGKESKLADLFSVTGAQHPSDLTEGDLHRWCTGNGTTIANNSVRQRISEARTFLSWCLRHGHISDDPAADLLARHSPLRRYRKVYGKKQGKHPGRWLTHDEAYRRLIPAVQDGTEVGLRDELVLRLGLLGLRQAEIAALSWADVAHLPRLTWTGKGHAPRQATAGNTLVALLHRYRSRYEAAVPRIDPADPVICAAAAGRAGPVPRQIRWGARLNSRNGIFAIVNSAGHRAGLGHIAPHDLRRSAAGILHHHVNEDGAHYFDLLDIQKVLGHSDPATTMRSYLDPMDTAAIDRAGDVLD